jgi:citrate lyase synthetase
VTTPAEAVTRETSTTQHRVLTVVCTLVVKATADVDDTTDTQCINIEKTVVAAASTLVHDLQLVSVDMGLSGEAEKPIIVANLSFEAFYRCAQSDPETAL